MYKLKKRGNRTIFIFDDYQIVTKIYMVLPWLKCNFHVSNFNFFQLALILRLSRVKHLDSTSPQRTWRKECLKNSLRGEFEKSTEIESNSTAVQRPAPSEFEFSKLKHWIGIDVSNIRNSLLSTTNLSAVERNDTLHLTTGS